MDKGIQYILALVIIAAVILLSMVIAQSRNAQKRDQMREIAEEMDVEIEGLIDAEYMYGDRCKINNSKRTIT